jgi:uncharacterized protein (TIGR03083 family)
MKLSPRYDAPPILSMEGMVDDQRVPVLHQRARLAATLVGLTDEQWRSASRCDGWTVQDVVAHLVGVNAFWRSSVSAGLAGTPTRVLDGFDPAATPPLMVGPMRTLTPAEVLDQFVSSNDALIEAIAALDDTGWSMLAETPAGHVPIRLLAQHALWDSWVHERDIALPLGLTPAVEPEEVLSCLRYAAALSPGFAISSGRACGGAFSVETSDPESRFWLEIGESVAVREGSGPHDAPCLRGGALELAEALSLRAPLPRSAPAEWRRQLAGLAAAFDSELETI